MQSYETVIIGAGPGGYQAALELGKAGKKVLLIDKTKENIGGTCLNVGCIPTKNYLQSASFISQIPHIKKLGLKLEYNGVDLKQLKEKTIELKNEIRSGVVWMLDKYGVELLYGDAGFLDANTLKVDNVEVKFEKCIIATGSKIRELENLPFDAKRIISSSDIFNLEKFPFSIAIVGSGAIGCEAASFFNAFGVEVTLIGRSEYILSKEDVDISKALSRVFKRNGINLINSASIKIVKTYEDAIELIVESEDAQQILKCDMVLSVSGRIPNTDNLNLKNAGVKIDAKGFIEITPSFETSQKNIYAIGDCIDSPAFAHTAYKEAVITAQNIINSASDANTRISPSTVFTNPQVASCGIKESDAKEKNLNIEVLKAYYKTNAKAKIIGDDSGFAKVIISKENNTILGAVIIGVDATEIIHELVFAVEKKMTVDELREVVHAHPTVSEIISYL